MTHPLWDPVNCSFWVRFSSKIPSQLCSLFLKPPKSAPDADKAQVLGSSGLGLGMSGPYLSCALTPDTSLSKSLLSSISCLLLRDELCRAVVSPAQQWPLDVTIIQVISLLPQMALDQAGSIFKAVVRNLPSVFPPFLGGSIHLTAWQT